MAESMNEMFKKEETNYRVRLGNVEVRLVNDCGGVQIKATSAGRCDYTPSEFRQLAKCVTEMLAYIDAKGTP